MYQNYNFYTNMFNQYCLLSLWRFFLYIRRLVYIECIIITVYRVYPPPPSQMQTISPYMYLKFAQTKLIALFSSMIKSKIHPVLNSPNDNVG